MNPRHVLALLTAATLPLVAASDAFAQQQAAPLYGQQLMTEAEQQQHRERMRSLETDEQRAAFREQHRQEMQRRARERGVELPDVAAQGGPGAGNAATPGVRGRELMTEEERQKQRAKMRSATSAEERERIRSEHHVEMQERARQEGIELPDEPPPRPGGGPGQGGGGRGRP